MGQGEIGIQQVGNGMKTRTCTRCGCVAAPGKTKCLDCLDYEAVAQMRYWHGLSDARRKELTKRKIETNKRRYDRLKENHICVKCGKRKVTEGHATCVLCREKLREKQRERREQFAV